MIVLTQKEADELLQMLKACVNATIDFPSRGKRCDFDVISKCNRSDKFMITINNSAKRTDKISINALYKKGNIKLMRLDIGNPPPPHKNPDGEKINCNHLHIYKEGYEIDYAIPFDIGNSEIDSIFYGFLDRFNVVDKPKVSFQKHIEEL